MTTVVPRRNSCRPRSVCSTIAMIGASCQPHEAAGRNGRDRAGWRRRLRSRARGSARGSWPRRGSRRRTPVAQRPGARARPGGCAGASDSPPPSVASGRGGHRRSRCSVGPVAARRRTRGVWSAVVLPRSPPAAGREGGAACPHGAVRAGSSRADRGAARRSRVVLQARTIGAVRERRQPSHHGRSCRPRRGQLGSRPERGAGRRDRAALTPAGGPRRTASGVAAGRSACAERPEAVAREGGARSVGGDRGSAAGRRRPTRRLWRGRRTRGA